MHAGNLMPAASAQPESASGGSGERKASDALRTQPSSGSLSSILGLKSAGSSSSPSDNSAGSIAVVAPANPNPQPLSYVLTNGVALPLPRGYLTNPYVDQGVDYAAPGGTPLYAMGDGVIIGAGIGGFGPNAPILRITSGPLKGLEIYYGHAGPNLVDVGQHVHAGQQISEVGYGIVGISTGPHLEIGFADSSGSPIGAGASTMMSLLQGSY
jgi:murein DD-endopeptidase MepM/ murein hydrolase activator NlpD